MLDLTMCSGNECSMKESCRRYMSVASKERQSYFIKPPLIERLLPVEIGGQTTILLCEYYIPMN